MNVSGQKWSVLLEPLYQTPEPDQQHLSHEVNYVNFDPTQQQTKMVAPPQQPTQQQQQGEVVPPLPPVHHQPSSATLIEQNSKAMGSNSTTAITNKSIQQLKNQANKQLRPHSAEVISMRDDFFDLKSSPENLKSESDSRLGFKDTKPEVQETVNERIAKNMTAFLSFTNPLSEGDVHMNNTSNTLPLEPVSVSSSGVSPRQQPHVDYWKQTIDPLLTNSSSSQENLYEEIKEQPRNSQASASQTLRPRPKGNVPIPQETTAAYRKGSLDAYAQSVKKDFDLLSQQLGPTPAASSSSCGNLPERISSLNVSTDKAHQYPTIQNTHYLQKYDTVIPISKLAASNTNNGNNSTSSTSKLNPPSKYLQPQQNQQQTGEVPSIAAERSPDYYKDFLLSDQKLNHFTYDSKAPATRKTPSPTSAATAAKGKSRQAAQNYTNNQWDLFEDCVKDPKKLDKNRRSSKTAGKRISWPKNDGGETVSTPGVNNSVGKKEEFSEKFKKIRVILPEASVGECLEGLRSSGNDVDGAVRYIQILKLYRYNFGFSFEECKQLLEKYSFDYTRAEQDLKIRYVKAQFKKLDMVQIQDTLRLCNWDVSLTLLTIFLQHCNGFGLDEKRARSIFNENHQESVLKALEMAKIVRVAEITSKPENVCFKTLTHCHWSVERAVNHIFSS